jgi:hypothetical protein
MPIARNRSRQLQPSYCSQITDCCLIISPHTLQFKDKPIGQLQQVHYVVAAAFACDDDDADDDDDDNDYDDDADDDDDDDDDADDDDDDDDDDDEVQFLNFVL